MADSYHNALLTGIRLTEHQSNVLKVLAGHTRIEGPANVEHLKQVLTMRGATVHQCLRALATRGYAERVPGLDDYWLATKAGKERAACLRSST